MPIIKSAKKRVKTARKATARNIKTKRSFRSAIKAFQASLKSGKGKGAEELAKAQSAIDTAVKKGVLHKNTAGRKKARLAKAAKENGVKPASSPKKATPKTPKKSATKKTATKKTTVKKATTSKKKS